MINFWYSYYELSPSGLLGALAGDHVRKGALLKVQWPNEKIGYADIFPWPELGDADIETQITALSKGKVSALVEQSIWLAKRDADLRVKGKNAFAGAAKVKNHYLISDLSKFTDNTMGNLRQAGFTTLKIKVGRDIEEEVAFVQRSLRQNPITIRLDFNARTNFQDYERFMTQLSQAERARIEYSEDPFPWDPEAWKEASVFAPVAMDNEYEKVNWDKLKGPPPFKVMVIKPARQDLDKTLKIVNKYAMRMVVTSAMDHPVGVAHACHVAAELKKFYPNTLLDCGCLTLKVYRPNEFFSRVQTNGPYLTGINGTGIGFDDLLTKVPWEPLKK